MGMRLYQRLRIARYMATIGCRACRGPRASEQSVAVTAAWSPRCCSPARRVDPRNVLHGADHPPAAKHATCSRLRRGRATPDGRRGTEGS